MTHFVQRTCTEIRQVNFSKMSENDSRPIEDYKDRDSYVLLGAPGSGKTTEFERQARLSGGHYVTARDFITFENNLGWEESTLFIDGLDEIRAGSDDKRTPFDSIRKNLEHLGCPRFRLSCRDADWFGSNDREHLKTVSKDGEVTVLHLDPLSEGNICKILQRSPDIKDTDQFMAATLEKGIEGLLTNPQSLDMLTIAVAGFSWPDTRKQTFELACQSLLKEHNQEHRNAGPDSVGITKLMDIAGKLCAIQLLSGASGFALPGGESGRDFLELERITDEDHSFYRQVLGTKLFQAGNETRHTPVHRQIAEFLAARYLAIIIGKGLPIGRILALITGHDGAIVSELRGLSAWLVAHNQPGRREIIARDPLGVILYGDVRGLPTNEKCWILEGLEREVNKNPWFLHAVHIDSRAGDFFTLDMVETIRSILTGPSRDDTQQSFVLILVKMLENGKPLPGLDDVLVRILRDDTWSHGIKTHALSTFVRFQQENGQPIDELKMLLVDVDAGRIPDFNDDLLGCLLSELYPENLSVSEVMQYFRLPKKDASYWGIYKLFWTTRIQKKSSNAQLSEFLDEFVVLHDKQIGNHASWRWINYWQGIFLTLLRSLLDNSQIEPDANRLFDWLEIATRDSDEVPTFGNLEDNTEHSYNWLSQHPDVQKALFAIGLERCLESPECICTDGFDSCMAEVEHRLLSRGQPLDFGKWCLEQAMATNFPITAEYLVKFVAKVLIIPHRTESLTREKVKSRISGNRELLDVFLKQTDHFTEKDLQKKSVRQDAGSQENPRELEWKNRKRQRQMEWRDRVKPQEEALRNNTAQPDLLHQLARAYLGGYSDIRGDTPRDRLQDLLGGDEKLIDAVLEGIRGSIWRDDLPTDVEVIRLGTGSRVHYLSFSFMAGLDELCASEPASETSLNDDQVRLALAIHYNVPVWPRSRNQADEPPAWIPSILQTRPEVVSDILVRTARARLQNGSDFTSSLYHLAHDQDHAVVARLSTLTLLKAFPVRCTERQLSSLHYLLQAACLHCEKEQLVELIEKKLVHRSMNVAQHVYWLATGLLAAPNAYHERLESFVDGNERRVRRLVEFIARRYDRPHMRNQPLDVKALSLLIRVLGVFYRPYHFDTDTETDTEEGGWVTPSMDAADAIKGYIDALASIPSAAASQELSELGTNEKLRSWRSSLIDAVYRQNLIRREAEFHHFDVEQIVNVLDNCKPTSAADLAALTFDKLAEIAKNIRDSNTSDWLQYWNVNSHNRAVHPKPEEACRDALLSVLKLSLGLQGVDAQPEGRYADNKRADIRVAYGKFNVPVEIKKSCHRDLWSAIKRQLIAKYTRDPGAEGYGIYLVLWFGNTDHCRPTPSAGPLPKNASELNQQLSDTLTVDEKLKISICVIDVSEPN